MLDHERLLEAILIGNRVYEIIFTHEVSRYLQFGILTEPQSKMGERFTHACHCVGKCPSVLASLRTKVP